jgi:hypothetical protein
MAQPLHFLPFELNSYRFCILDAPCAGKVPGSLRSELVFLGVLEKQSCSGGDVARPGMNRVVVPRGQPIANPATLRQPLFLLPERQRDKPEFLSRK